MGYLLGKNFRRNDDAYAVERAADTLHCPGIDSKPFGKTRTPGLPGVAIRDIRRKIAGNAELEAVFAWPLSRADQIRSQQQRQRGWKLYSFHAPEVECIGRARPARLTNSV